MESLRLGGVYFSLLHAFSIPIGQLNGPNLAFLSSPAKYLEYIVGGQLASSKVFIPDLGQFRSALTPHNLKKGREFPQTDPVWNALKGFYDTQLTVGGKLPFFPCIPLVLDYLPSKHREYFLNLTGLQGEVGERVSKRSRLSLSIYYFPVGCAISRVGLYLEPQADGPTPDNLIRTFKFPKNVQVVVKKDGKVVAEDDLVEFSRKLEHKFLDGMCGYGTAEDPVSIGRYSIFDITNASRPLDEQQDGEFIFRTAESTFLDSPAAIQGNIAYRMKDVEDHYRRGITIGGDRFCFNWIPGEIVPMFQLRYRRWLRYLTMILLAQIHVSQQVNALEQTGWRDKIKSETFLHQLSDGIFGPPLTWPLSFMHCLLSNRSFSSQESVNQQYWRLKSIIDRQHLIDAAIQKMTGNLTELQQQVNTGAQTVAGQVSNVISAIETLKP